jgi:hypothetical protein
MESMTQVRRLRTVVAAGLVAAASLVGVVTSHSARADTEATPRPAGSTPITACATPTYRETYGPWASVQIGYITPGVYEDQDVRFEVDGQTIASAPVESYEGSLEGILEFPRPGTYVGDLVYSGGSGIPPFRRRTTMVAHPMPLPFFDSPYRSVLSYFPTLLSLSVLGLPGQFAQLSRDGVVIEPTETLVLENPARLVKSYAGLDPTVSYLAEMKSELAVSSPKGVRFWPAEQRRLVKANGSYFSDATIQIPGTLRTGCTSRVVVYVYVEGVGSSRPFEIDGRPAQAGSLLSPGTHTIRFTDALVPIERVVEIPTPDPQNITYTSGYVYPDFSVHPIDPPWVIAPATTTVPPATTSTAAPTSTTPTTITTTAPPATTTTVASTMVPATTTTVQPVAPTVVPVTTTTVASTVPPTSFAPTTTIAPPPPTSPTTTQPTTTPSVVSVPTTAPLPAGNLVVACPPERLNIGDRFEVATNAGKPGSVISLTANGISLGSATTDPSGRAAVQTNLWEAGAVSLVLTESVFRNGIETRRSGACGVSSFDSRVVGAPTINVPRSVQVGKPFAITVSGIGRPSGRIDFFVGGISAGSVKVTDTTVVFATTVWNSSQATVTAEWVDFDRGAEFRRRVMATVAIEPNN